MKSIKFEITTKSNLFIGGLPTTFEIGGVDQYTITDYNGKPFIPASSLKGSLRKIAVDVESEKDSLASEIAAYYKNYLSDIQSKNEEQIKKLEGEIKGEKLKNLQNHFSESLNKVSVGYLFGIKGFNDAPKLIFNDLTMQTETEEWYSIDSKNSIGDDMKANPRTYKTVRPEITFSGEILFYKMEKEYFDLKQIGEFVTKMLLKFEQGIYRLGNSGSRGYGKVEVRNIIMR